MKKTRAFAWRWAATAAAAVILFGGSPASVGGEPIVDPDPQEVLRLEPVDRIPTSFYSGAGDVNGDGFEDILIAFPYLSFEHEQQGEVALYPGGPGGVAAEALWSRRGNRPKAHTGTYVTGVGDVNGDGYDDIAYAEDIYEGRYRTRQVLVVHFGSPDGPSDEPDWTYEAYYPREVQCLRSMAAAGDVNGDGFGDLAVGCYAAHGYWGMAWVFHGSPSGPGDEPDWSKTGNRPGWFLGTWFGEEAEGAGDVNGDGYDDLLVNAPLETSDFLTDRGHAYVFAGSAAGLGTEPLWMARGVELEQEYSWGVAGGGDVNGDGYADVIVGSPWYNGSWVDLGRVYVYFGSPAGPSASEDWGRTGEGGLGLFVATGDVNGDGYDEVMASGRIGDGRFSIFPGSASGPADDPAFAFTGTLSTGLAYGGATPAGDVNGDGAGDLLVRATAPAGLVFYVYFGVPSNQPPVAVCPGDQIVECTGDLAGDALLDGSASYDPEGGALLYTWTSDTCAFRDPSAAVAEASCPLGENTASLVVNDGAKDSDACTTRIEVVDTTPPAGRITFPEDGSCHGPAALPVVVADDFADRCDPEIGRSYDPPGGPAYAEHGDHRVTVTAADRSGNAASDAVGFTVDTVAPAVAIHEPPGTFALGSGSLPFSIAFTATDDDGASGGVVYERVLLEGCVAYDGRTYGDGDGLLSDESLVLGPAELCRLAERCGFQALDSPTLGVEATDCGGNTGSDARTLPGSVSLIPGLCGM